MSSYWTRMKAEVYMEMAIEANSEEEAKEIARNRYFDNQYDDRDVYDLEFLRFEVFE